MEFSYHKERMRSYFFPGNRLVLLGCVVLVSSGCWEEIHYIPSKPPIARSTEPESGEVAQVEDSTSQGPTSDELFGSGSGPETSSEVPTDSVQEEILAEQSPSTETQLDESPSSASRPEESAEDSMGDLFAEDDSTDETEELKVTENTAPQELEGTAVLRPSRQALAAWKMSSRWSYAAAINAKGLGEDSYGDSLQQATYAAELLDLELPEFPTIEKEDLEAAMIDYMIHTGRTQLADQLAVEYSPEYAALAELAIKSNVLLLVYTPKSQHLGPIVSSIRRAAENSTLPPSLWEELVELLKRRAPFSAVKASILRLHQQVGVYLGGSPE